MRLSEILSGTGVLMAADAEITGITMDSRAVAPGDLFMAVKGLNVDGAAYIDDAKAKGAAACVSVSRAEAAVLAANFFDNPARRLRLFGVTGTKGKTTITYIMEAIFAEAGITAGVIGTTGALLNGEPLGVAYATSTTPDCVELHKILRGFADAGADACVMEATSHALALDKLKGIDYEIGVFTNLTRDHLDFHKDFDDYAAAKARLFAQSRAAIINADSPYAPRMLAAAKTARTYGFGAADYQAVNVELSQGGAAFDVVSQRVNTRFTLPIPGQFTVYNALAAIAAAAEAGIDALVIQSALAKLAGVPGRIQPVANKRGFAVIVDYAHSPDSLENILLAARVFTKGELIAVFGCGGNRDRGKRPIMGEIAGRLADYSFVTSDNPRDESPEAIIDEVAAGFTKREVYEKMTDREQAIAAAINRAKPGDTVVIAGKGHEDYQEFEHKRRVHFDDAEVARKWLGEAI